MSLSPIRRFLREVIPNTPSAPVGLSPSAAAREYGTIHVRCWRQAGHTRAAEELACDWAPSVVFVPTWSMADRTSFAPTRPVAFAHFRSWRNRAVGCTPLQMMIVDPASIEPEFIERLYEEETLALFGPNPPRIVLLG